MRKKVIELGLVLVGAGIGVLVMLATVSAAAI